MPYTLYNIYGSPPCGLVRMLAKHIGVDLQLNNLNTLKNEHRTPEYLKRPRIYELKRPTVEDVEEFERHVIKGFELVLADGKYVVGDRLSLADLGVVAHLTRILEVPFLDAEKYPKLKAYYNRVKEDLPYFDEVNQPGIGSLRARWAHIQ
ncbi:hypothetical protein HPB50_001852 [Hyalomma asiaticum]|uniref:Uncharacterized protein n=1 Tax=Hyalomma asiaticum TaxID=266040 RepID=A0ACB7SD07_HYAAI|nr:hypothetical protein HPB50_001852 [Hyalomma asiaticum]